MQMHTAVTKPFKYYFKSFISEQLFPGKDTLKSYRESNPCGTLLYSWVKTAGRLDKPRNCSSYLNVILKFHPKGDLS